MYVFYVCMYAYVCMCMYVYVYMWFLIYKHKHFFHWPNLYYDWLNSYIFRKCCCIPKSLSLLPCFGVSHHFPWLGKSWCTQWMEATGLTWTFCYESFISEVTNWQLSVLPTAGTSQRTPHTIHPSPSMPIISPAWRTPSTWRPFLRETLTFKEGKDLFGHSWPCRKN